MIRIYDADDPEADLPLTEAEQEALDETDRLRAARKGLQGPGWPAPLVEAPETHRG